MPTFRYRLPQTVLVLCWRLASACVVCLPYHVSAQTPPPLQMPALEVQGQRLGVEQIVRETSTFATVIDTSGATAQVDSVADLLNESVGVQVRKFGGLGAFSTVSIRGSTPSQVEVFLDGVLLNRANAGLVDLGSLPIDNVERIEVYRGFAPLQLGAGGIGGAIHLVTRPVAGATTNTVSASYGSFETRKFSLYRSQGFEKIGYTILVNYTESDNDFQFLDDNGTRFNLLDDEVVRRRNNDFNAFNVNAKGEALLGGWQLTLANDLYTKDQGVPGQSSIQSETARFHVWRNIVTLRAERKRVPWPSTDVAFQVSYLWDQERFKDPNGRIGVGVQDQLQTSHTLSGNGLLTWYLDALHQTVSVSLEGRYETSRRTDLLPEQRGLPASEGPLQRRTNVTLAFQDEIRLFDERLALRPLLRYQYVDSDFGEDVTLRTVRRDVPRVSEEHLFNPSLGVKYNVVSWLALKGNVGRATRVPTLFELFGDRGVTLGNPDLVSERSTNWDVGFTAEWPKLGVVDRLFVEYAYFGSQSKDLIVFVQNSQNTARAENIGAAKISGHELSWSLTAWQHLRFYGNYTYQFARDTSETISRGNILPGRPTHEWHQGIEVFADFGRLGYEFDYTARNFLDRANAFVVEDRLLHNVRLTVSPWGKRLKLTIEAKNLTDSQITDVRGFPLPGRSLFGTIEGRF